MSSTHAEDALPMLDDYAAKRYHEPFVSCTTHERGCEVVQEMSGDVEASVKPL